MVDLDFLSRYSLNDLKDFLDLNNKEICLFGAGDIGKNIKKILEGQGKKITYFLDNNPEKWGTSIDGVIIKSPIEILTQKPLEYKIIICIANSSQIALQLNSYKLEIFKDYVSFELLGWINEKNFLDSVGKAFYNHLLANREQFSKVMNLLADDHSKVVYNRVIQYRLRALEVSFCSGDDFPIPYSEYLENSCHKQRKILETLSIFPKNDIFKHIPLEVQKDIAYQISSEPYTYLDIHPGNKKVIIDAGAFTGDTAGMFCYFSPSAMIYSFEPEGENYQSIEKLSRYLPNVKPINSGLWSISTNCSFQANSNKKEATCVGFGDQICTVVSLDDFVNKHKIDRVDFIKMDIEGAEFNALQGAIESIKRFKPCLAICLYHKPQDLWRIPLWIHENLPNYKIYIDHKDSIYPWGTVCFAKPDF